MSPSPQHLDDVDRDLARAASIVYAQARDPQDPLTGQHIDVDGADIVLLEPVAEDLRAAARKVLEQAVSSLPDSVDYALMTVPIRFADNLAAPSVVRLDGHGQAILIPAEWSMVFCDSYVSQAVKKFAEANRPIAEGDIRQALVSLLASHLWLASQAAGSSGVPVPN